MTAKCGPRPRPGVLDIAPYVPGTSALGARPVIKLSSNETPFGPSPARGRGLSRGRGLAVPLSRRLGAGLARGDRQDLWARRRAHRLRRGLRRAAEPAGAGLSRPGRRGDLQRARLPGLPDCHPGARCHARGCAGDGVDRRRGCDPGRVTPATRMVFLANPNNPTGTYLSFDEVKRLRAGLPADVLLVLDAAYAEYVRANDYEAGIELVATTPNTVMTRTFSKIYGLASLRLGWAYCPQGGRRCAQPRARAVQRHRVRPSPPASRRLRIRPRCSGRRTITRSGVGAWPKRLWRWA